MDQDSKDMLAMFDRVTRIEPQLRDTLAAARLTAKDAVSECWNNYSWKTNVIVSDIAEHETWVKALKETSRHEQQLAGIIASLTETAGAMKANGIAQATNNRAACEAEAAYLSGLTVDEALKSAIDKYVAHRKALMDWADARSSGDWRARTPEQPDTAIFDAVLPLLDANKTEAQEACRTRYIELQDEQGRLSVEFDAKRAELKEAVAHMDDIANRMDAANLEAAKAVKGLLDPLWREDRRLKLIGKSAVDTSNAVIKLALRVAIVKAHPPTAGDMTF